MPYIIAFIQNFDVLSHEIQEKIESQFPFPAFTRHCAKLPDLVLGEAIIKKRIKNSSLIFCESEIYVISDSSLKECAKALNEFFKWAQKWHSNVKLEMRDKKEIERFPDMVIPLIPLITYVIGVLFAKLGFLWQVMIGFFILAALVTYLARAELIFKYLKWKYERGWRQ